MAVTQKLADRKAETYKTPSLQERGPYEDRTARAAVEGADPEITEGFGAVSHGLRPPLVLNEEGFLGKAKGLVSKADTVNPKDLFGNKKVSMSKLPASAVAHGSMAMMDGAEKYGAYNWRDKSVIASIYIDGAKRHMDLWFEGQQNASDSGVHHLGHAIACCAILLDAELTNSLVDDRPIFGDPDMLEQLYDQLAETIAARRARKAAIAA